MLCGYFESARSKAFFSGKKTEGNGRGNTGDTGESKRLHGGYIVPGLPVLFREVLMVIGIKHLPEGRAEDTLGIQDGNAEGVSVHNLVGIVINTHFTTDTLDHDEPGKDTLLDHIEILGKAAEGHVHIFMGLTEHIHGNAVMAVELEEVNSISREGLILTGIKLHASLVDNKLPVLYQILAQVLPCIHTISTGNGDIGINTNGAFPVLAAHNPICKAAGKTAA
ncbi:MAG: hypothetical protein DBY24_10410 [Prevotellaceae bacterium]|nr:MAG: hypothetical protein DBY24_10410 [Prevotellaceae bacterium]